MESIPINDPDKNSFILEHPALNQPIRGGASKTALLALTISVFQRWQLILLLFLLRLFGSCEATKGHVLMSTEVVWKDRSIGGWSTLVQASIFCLFDRGGGLLNIQGGGDLWPRRLPSDRALFLIYPSIFGGTHGDSVRADVSHTELLCFGGNRPLYSFSLLSFVHEEGSLVFIYLHHHGAERRMLRGTAHMDHSLNYLAF